MRLRLCRAGTRPQRYGRVQLHNGPQYIGMSFDVGKRDYLAFTYLPRRQFGENYHRQRKYQWPVYLSLITVRFVMAHIVAAATGKDQESEKVHTLRS
jgi:hypothetical protein